MKFGNQFSKVFDKIHGWYTTGFKYLPNFVVAILVLVVFYGIARMIRKLVSHLMHNVTHNKTIIDLLETISGVIVIAIGLFIALSVLRLSGAVTSLLAGAGVIGLALGFAFQDIAANFISGIFISIRHPFGKGDIIESKGYYGTVQKINLRCTLIRTPQGQVVYVPNKDVYGEALINYTENFERRIDLSCGVSYGDDLEKAKRVAIEAVESLDNYNDDRDVQFLYDEFGGSSINFKIRFWVDFQSNMDYLTARSDAIIAITKKFDEEDIMIPFPIRTLDFGIRGGEKLDSMLQDGKKLSTDDEKSSAGGNKSSQG